jgi:hypothetical protein
MSAIAVHVTARRATRRTFSSTRVVSTDASRSASSGTAGHARSSGAATSAISGACCAAIVTARRAASRTTAGSHRPHRAERSARPHARPTRRDALDADQTRPPSRRVADHPPLGAHRGASHRDVAARAGASHAREIREHDRERGVLCEHVPAAARGAPGGASLEHAYQQRAVRMRARFVLEWRADREHEGIGQRHDLRVRVA